METCAVQYPNMIPYTPIPATRLSAPSLHPQPIAPDNSHVPSFNNGVSAMIFSQCSASYADICAKKVGLDNGQWDVDLEPAAAALCARLLPAFLYR